MCLLPPLPLLGVTGRYIPRVSGCWLCQWGVVREDWREIPFSLLLVVLPLLGCLSLHELGSYQAATAGTLTPDRWLRLVRSGNLASSLGPYSLLEGTVASCCHFTIPCSASSLFQHLGNQVPVLNDLCLKHRTGPD